MMGPKTLSEIKDELRAGLAKTGKDPIQWLEDRIRQLQKEPKPAPSEIEILQALRSVLEGSRKPKPRRTRARAKPAR